MSVNIGAATFDNIDQVARLFDGYRVFYGQETDLIRAEKFISDRIEKSDSNIIVASDTIEKRAIGFVQLYPSFSSVRTTPILILNDLFVDPRYRRMGVGSLLMTAAGEFARSMGVDTLKLSTQLTNFQAQELYRKMGYKQDEEFLHFSLTI